MVGPKAAASAAGSAAARPATVSMPSAASFRAVLPPMPHSASGGRAPSTSNQVPNVSRKIPAGLPKPVASLACSLFSPMPTEQSSRVAALMRAWISRATDSGSPESTAMNASSQPMTSTT